MATLMKDFKRGPWVKEPRLLAKQPIPGGDRSYFESSCGELMVVEQVQGVINHVEILDDSYKGGAVRGGLAVAGGRRVLPVPVHAVGV